MAALRCLFVSTLVLLLCSQVARAGPGESCVLPVDIGLTGLVPASGAQFNETVDHINSAASVGDIPTCSPAVPSAQTNGTFWFRWTPTTTQNVFFTLTGPKIDPFEDVTTFSARLSLVSNPDGNNCTDIRTEGTCLLRVADLCQGYPGNLLPPSVQVFAGTTYFIVIDRPRLTSGAAFQLNIFPSPTIFEESFSAAVIPVDWESETPLAGGAYSGTNLGWVAGDATAVSVSAQLVFPPGPDGPFIAYNPYIACPGNVASCDHTQTYLYSPNITFNGQSSSALLSFDTWFFNGFIASHQVIEHVATVQIRSELNNTWGTLFKV
jgi:hypothetical protein